MIRCCVGLKSFDHLYHSNRFGPNTNSIMISIRRHCLLRQCRKPEFMIKNIIHSNRSFTSTLTATKRPFTAARNDPTIATTAVADFGINAASLLLPPSRITKYGLASSSFDLLGSVSELLGMLKANVPKGFEEFFKPQNKTVNQRYYCFLLEQNISLVSCANS